MYLRSTKKIGAEVYLNEPIGKDKDDNEISLIDILENDEKNIEEEVDFKLKMKQIYEKIKYKLKNTLNNFNVFYFLFKKFFWIFHCGIKFFLVMM